MNIRIFRCFAAVVVLLTADSSAHAIDTCKVKVDKKTGVLNVDAKGVAGPLLWGTKPGSETSSFFNAGTCVSGANAKKCQLANPATLAAKTPPRGCTLYLADGVQACSAWISGCSPAPRDGAGFLVKDTTGATVGFSDTTGTVVLRNDGNAFLSIPLKADGTGFAASAFLIFASADCSGTAMVSEAPSPIKPVNMMSSAGPAYYASGVISMITPLSFLNANDSFVSQAACDFQNGPGNSTFVAPSSCCVPYLLSAQNASTLSTTNLAVFSPPFHLEEQ